MNGCDIVVRGESRLMYCNKIKKYVDLIRNRYVILMVSSLNSCLQDNSGHCLHALLSQVISFFKKNQTSFCIFKSRVKKHSKTKTYFDHKTN